MLPVLATICGSKAVDDSRIGQRTTGKRDAGETEKGEGAKSAAAAAADDGQVDANLVEKIPEETEENGGGESSTLLRSDNVVATV